jgi:HEAT repeat protein
MTAVLLRRQAGDWTSRIRGALRDASRPAEEFVPSEAELLDLAREGRAELARTLDEGEIWERAAAARVLGRIGGVEALRRAFAREEEAVWVRAAAAGALARTGDRSAVREIRPFLCCEHALGQIAEVDTMEDLDAWLAEK